MGADDFFAGVAELRARGPVLVIGDVMLDRTHRGRARDTTGAAGAPIVRVEETVESPGGAANVAVNLAQLGVPTAIVGVVGSDLAGARLRACLRQRGVATDALIVRESRPTTVKTRVFADDRLLTRFDVESQEMAADVEARALLGVVASLIPEASAAVLSDYCKGAVSRELAERVCQLVAARSIPLVVDSKSVEYGHFRGATTMTPTEVELRQVLARAYPGQNDHEIDHETDHAGGARDGAAIFARLVSRARRSKGGYTPASTAMCSWSRTTSAMTRAGRSSTTRCVQAVACWPSRCCIRAISMPAWAPTRFGRVCSTPWPRRASAARSWGRSTPPICAAI